MSGNINTNYTRKYQKKQNAMGLCRYCPQPLDPNSNSCCTEHLLKQRMYRPAELRHEARQERRDAIVKFILAHPTRKYREVATVFNVSISTVCASALYVGLERQTARKYTPKNNFANC